MTPGLSCQLPSYSGPCPVGVVDIEAPCDGRSIHPATIRSTGRPAFRLDTVLFSLYYPAEDTFSSHHRHAQEPHSRQSSHPNRLDTQPETHHHHHHWQPRPIRSTAAGLAHFAKVPGAIAAPVTAVFTFFLWLLSGHVRIPATVDAPLRRRDESDGSVASGKYPVIIFSHGTAGGRTTNSQYCGELASRGFVVAAIEHRDGTCPASRVCKVNDGCHGGDCEVPHFAVSDLLHDRVDGPRSVDDPVLQRARLEFREAEIAECVRVLRMLEKGEGRAVYDNNGRREGRTFEGGGWLGRIDVERVILVGHSCGATAVLSASRTGNTFSEAATPSSGSDAKIEATSTRLPLAGCIAFDPGRVSGPLNDEISVPLLIIQSHGWSKEGKNPGSAQSTRRPHFELVKQVADTVLRRTGESWFMTSHGTTHSTCTDASIIAPFPMRLVTGADVSGREGVMQYVRRTVEFTAIVKGEGKTGLLAEGVTKNSNKKGLFKPWKTKDGTKEDWQIHVAPEKTG